MCDYSLHCVSNRPARLADKLVTTRFRNTLTRGFSAIGEPHVAVCLRPGTELAFETEAEPEVGLFRMIMSILMGTDRRIPHKVGRFRQINLADTTTHHDAIEFPDGQLVLVTFLRPGQRATVLQLPAEAHRAAQEPAEDASPAALAEPVRAAPQ